MTSVETTEKAIRTLLANLISEGVLAKEIGLDVTPEKIANASFAQIMELAVESLPLARLQDNSDIIVHAEGPGASDHTPSLHALNWINNTVEKQVRVIARSLIDLAGVSIQQARRIAGKLDIRSSGFAPGSIYAGFVIDQTKSRDLLREQDEPYITSVIDAVTVLPAISEFVLDDSVSTGINDLIPDPAIRDIQLNAALNLSPSGSYGIHTLELISKEHRGAYSQKERLVIRDALRHSKIAYAKKQGAFIGEISALDLDKKRFHIRHRELGTIRCVISELTRHKASDLLRDQVKVSGEYEYDKSGKPRLLYVESVETVKPKAQTKLDL